MCDANADADADADADVDVDAKCPSSRRLCCAHLLQRMQKSDVEKSTMWFALLTSR